MTISGGSCCDHSSACTGSAKSVTRMSSPMSCTRWRRMARCEAWSSTISTFIRDWLRPGLEPAYALAPGAGSRGFYLFDRLRPHVREQQYVTDRGRIGEQHHQPVDAHAQAAGRRQTDLQRADVVGV